MEGSAAKQWLRAVGVLFATVVGVGVFGLPFVFSRAGFGVGLLELVLLTVVMVTLSLMYASLTVATPGKHRYVTYIGRYLGSRGALVATVVLIVSVLGALLAFTIIGGDFLSSLSRGALTPTMASVVVLLAAAVLAFGGLKLVSRLVVGVVLILLALYVVLILSAAPAFDVTHLRSLPLSLQGLALPYGVIIFSLTGVGAIPEMHDLLGRRLRRLGSAIIAAYALIFLTYALFAAFVVGATGSATSPDAITGLAPFVPSWVGVLGDLLGTISAISIFTLLSMENVNTLVIDLHLRHRWAVLVTFFVPLCLFLLGFRQFIAVIGLVGGILNAILGMLIVVAYQRFKKISRHRPAFALSPLVSFFVLSAFVLGIVAQFWYHS